jgi:hypothetical protein
VSDAPDSPYWDSHEERGWTLGPRPADIADTEDLRRLLLAGPDLLSAEAADWCIMASLEFAAWKVKHLEPRPMG